MGIKITCINKDKGNHYNPYEAIRRFGWMNEETREKGFCYLKAMVDFVEKNPNRAYTQDFLGKRAYLVVRVSRSGNKYVRTVTDGKETNNLLELSECA
jgi:hypothetical protein